MINMYTTPVHKRIGILRNMQSFEMIVTALLLFFGVTCGEENARILTPNGFIQGFKTKTWTGKEFYAFEGIPYAQPPIGDLRFKEAVPPQPWVGTWPANKFKICMQYFHVNLGTDEDMVIGDEDCLYVNVYKPKENTSELLDVFVHIHGGAFMFGAGGFYGPNILLDRDVVYVSINYRLGPLGFLSTEDNVLPGNLGMKDQVSALKWIKENIQYFGGNPNSITITGLSAGGASVHLHLLSPLSKGLVTKAVSQSGHALDCWVLAEGSLRKAKTIADKLGCPTDCSRKMIDCLKNRPARQIVETVGIFQPWLYNPYSPLGVVIDKDSKEPFLPEHPYKLLKQKKVNDVPWILSHTSEEGLYPAADFVSDPKYLQELEQNWNKYLPHILHYEETVDQDLQDKVSQKIKEHYLKGKPASIATYPEIVQLIGDRLFVIDSDTVARMHTAAIKSPVYYYYYTYRGSRSMSEIFARNGNNYGVSHGDDTMALVSTRIPSLSTESDREMSRIMVDMWLSFGKTGVPIVNNVKWDPVSKKPNDLLHFLQIATPSNMKMRSEMHFKHHEFWKSLPIKEVPYSQRLPTKEEL